VQQEAFQERTYSKLPGYNPQVEAMMCASSPREEKRREEKRREEKRRELS
jgi:hypothetical protein